MKKLIISAIASIMAITSLNVSAVNSIKGDIDSNGDITVTDIRMLQDYILNREVEINYNNSDINSDGEIDIFDLGLLKKLVKDTEVSKTKAIKEKAKAEVEDIIANIDIYGYSISIIPTTCKKDCTLITKSNKERIIYIPDNVTKLNNNIHLEFTNEIKNLSGHIKVVGGSDLTDIDNMFFECKFDSIDLSEFDTSNVTNMSNAFNHCKAGSINFDNFDTHSVTNMEAMFTECGVKSLNLSSFDTLKVDNMSYMFEGYEAAELDLSSFNTENVKNMHRMFSKCKLKKINLKSFNTYNTTDMCQMFCEFNGNELDLSSFTAVNINTIAKMFYECNASVIDLSNFKVNNSRKIAKNSIFWKCTADVVTSDPIIQAAYDDRLNENLER